MYNFKSILNVQSQRNHKSWDQSLNMLRQRCLFILKVKASHSFSSEGWVPSGRSELYAPFDTMQGICWGQWKICLKAKSQSWLLWRRVVIFAILHWHVLNHSWRKFCCFHPLFLIFPSLISPFPFRTLPWCSWPFFLISSQFHSSHPLHSHYVISHEYNYWYWCWEVITGFLDWWYSEGKKPRMWISESFTATVFIFRKHCCGMFAKISLEPTALEIYFKSEST